MASIPQLLSVRKLVYYLAKKKKNEAVILKQRDAYCVGNYKEF